MQLRRVIDCSKPVALEGPKRDASPGFKQYTFCALSVAVDYLRSRAARLLLVWGLLGLPTGRCAVLSATMIGARLKGKWRSPGRFRNWAMAPGSYGTREWWLHSLPFHCRWSSVASDLIIGNISKTRTNRTSAWDQGMRWHQCNQSHFDGAPGDTWKDCSQRAFTSVWLKETSSWIRSEGVWQVSVRQLSPPKILIFHAELSGERHDDIMISYVTTLRRVAPRGRCTGWCLMFPSALHRLLSDACFVQYFTGRLTSAYY